MEDSFLRAINPSVPLRDLEAAVWIVVVGIVVAHLVILPKMFASAPRYATALLAMSVVGIAFGCYWVLDRPRDMFAAVLAYCAAFSVLCVLMARKASASTRRASVFVAFGLPVMVALVYFLAFSAR